jgi:hypothetical protein
MRKGGFVVLLTSLTVLASCSSGGGIGASPGHDSPKAATAGYLAGLAGNNATICSYVEPSEQSDCSADTSQVHFKVTGSYAIANEVVQGSEALVALTGHVCIVISETTTTQECHQNSDPNSGLPTSAGAFADAYQNSLNSSTSNTQACIEVDGSWYVNLDFGGSGSTATTTPSTTTPLTTETTTPATTTPATTATTAPTSTTPSTTPGTTTP